MKKGLRPRARGNVARHAIPTADLMKKGLRPEATIRVFGTDEIPTADLMKKGLRPITNPKGVGKVQFQQQT